MPKRRLEIDGHLRFWQKRFWDHIIRDEEDLAQHLDYIHYNPVKHGLVTRPEEWQHSSFIAWQERGAYPEQWGWTLPGSLGRNDWRHAE
jgi:putative transposase